MSLKTEPVITPTVRKLLDRRGDRPGAYLPALPLDVLAALHPLGAPALVVGLLICREAKMAGRECELRLSGVTLARIGLSRFSVLRALAKLERAGLVEVARQRGRRPTVRIKGQLAPGAAA